MKVKNLFLIIAVMVITLCAQAQIKVNSTGVVTIPNPFSSVTTIQGYIPEEINKAQLCIYNMQGAQVKCIQVADRGDVIITVAAGQLAAGVYTYILIGDSKTSDAKQMILTK